MLPTECAFCQFHVSHRCHQRCGSNFPINSSSKESWIGYRYQSFCNLQSLFRFDPHPRSCHPHASQRLFLAHFCVSGELSICLLRDLTNGEFSEVFGAIPNAVLLAVPVEISARWFGESERSLATAAGALSQLVGIAGGLAFSGFYVASQDLTFPKCVASFNVLFIVQGVVCVVTSVPGFFFRDSPPTPPSFARYKEEEEKTGSHTLLNDIKACFSVSSFWVLMIVFAAGYGTFFTVSVVMQEVVPDVVTATIVSITTIGSGVVGGFVGGVIMDKFRL